MEEGISVSERIISKEQFNLLFQGNDFVFFLKKVGTDFEYVYLNEPADRSMRHSAVGKLLNGLVPEETFNILIENYELAIKENRQIDYEDYSYYLSEIRKYETTVRPIFLENEIYILAITKEITIDRNMEDNFIFMRSIFNNSFLSTVLLSKEGYVYEANPTFVEDFGLTLDELQGKLFIELPFINQSSLTSFQNKLKQASAGEAVSTSISNFIDKSDGELSYLTTFTPIMRENEIVAIFIIFQDITQYIVQEKELRSTSHGFESFKAALYSVTDISITDISGTIIEVNESFLQTCRYDRDEIVGQKYQLLNSRYHSDEFFCDMWDDLLRGEIWRGEICNRTKYGENYWVDATIIPLKDESNIIQQFLMVNYNISEKKSMMTELKNIERTFRAITENTNDLIVITNEDGIILYTSPSYSKRLGYSVLELVGRFYEDFVADESKEGWRVIFNNLDLGTDGDIQIDLLLKAKDGQLIWTDGLMTIVSDQDKTNRYQYVMVSREVTQRKELEKQLVFMAFHDSLTQLPNRRFLMKEFPQLAEEATLHNHSIAILFIDGDDFKSINDKYGHDIGDSFIKEFGIALSNSLRTHDLVVRIGGDEFIIILNSLTMDIENRQKQIKQIIHRIQENLLTGWEIEGNKFSPTSSIGVAYYPDHAVQLDDLLEIADRALYEAKKIGKNSCIFADSSLYS